MIDDSQLQKGDLLNQSINSDKDNKNQSKLSQSNNAGDARNQSALGSNNLH
jgi:hypothetical protein